MGILKIVKSVIAETSRAGMRSELRKQQLQQRARKAIEMQRAKMGTGVKQ